jgi:hypothetical protein
MSNKISVSRFISLRVNINQVTYEQKILVSSRSHNEAGLTIGPLTDGPHVTRIYLSWTKYKNRSQMVALKNRYVLDLTFSVAMAALLCSGVQKRYTDIMHSD